MGGLVRIPLHLRQTAEQKDLAENSLGLTSSYEAWGWTDDSQPYFYWVVCSQFPPGMPRGKNIYAEATFVGYFLKLLPYEDHEGIQRATPLLIGKLIWHPTPDGQAANAQEWTWPWIAAGGVLILFVVRWVVWFARAGSRSRAATDPIADLRSGDPGADGGNVEDWLEQAPDDRAANSGDHAPDRESGPDEGGHGGWTLRDL